MNSTEGSFKWAMKTLRGSVTVPRGLRHCFKRLLPTNSLPGTALSSLRHIKRKCSGCTNALSHAAVSCTSQGPRSIIPQRCPDSGRSRLHAPQPSLCSEHTLQRRATPQPVPLGHISQHHLWLIIEFNPYRKAQARLEEAYHALEWSISRGLQSTLSI